MVAPAVRGRPEQRLDVGRKQAVVRRVAQLERHVARWEPRGVPRPPHARERLGRRKDHKRRVHLQRALEPLHVRRKRAPVAVVLAVNVPQRGDDGRGGRAGVLAGHARGGRRRWRGGNDGRATDELPRKARVHGAPCDGAEPRRVPLAHRPALDDGKVQHGRVGQRRAPRRGRAPGLGDARIVPKRQWQVAAGRKQRVQQPLFGPGDVVVDRAHRGHEGVVRGERGLQQEDAGVEVVVRAAKRHGPRGEAVGDGRKALAGGAHLRRARGKQRREVAHDQRVEVEAEHRGVLGEAPDLQARKHADLEEAVRLRGRRRGDGVDEAQRPPGAVQRKLVDGVGPRCQQQDHVGVQQRVGAVVQDRAPELQRGFVVARVLVRVGRGQEEGGDRVVRALAHGRAERGRGRGGWWWWRWW